MKSIDTTFSLLGTNSAWNIKVPFCGCSAENAATNSNENDGKRTDDPHGDADQKKANAN